VKVDDDKKIKIPEAEIKEDTPFVPSKIKKKDIGKSR